MEETAIKIENVSKRYYLGSYAGDSFRERLSMLFTNTHREEKEFWALKDISFEVPKGQVCGIIGRNGAGKSTLLKILSRITRPTEGSLEINGKLSSLLEVGTGFHPELSGRENIFLNGAILGMTNYEIKKSFDEIVSFSGVGKFLDTPVKNYSSGMYVRLAFAVAAHLNSEILIIDEVLAVGDLEFQKKCLDKMKNISSSGRTILFVSHNMHAVRSLCNTAVLLENGRLLYHGNIDEAIDQYSDHGTLTDSLEKIYDSSDTSNEDASLKRIKILCDKDKVYIGDSFRIEFEFEINFDGHADFDVTFHLSNSTRILVLVASTYYKKLHKSRSGGDKYLAVCEIPEYFLNEGKYYISKLLLVRNGREAILQVQDPYSFNVHFTPDTVYGYLGRKKGLVRPLLNWDIK